MTASVSNCKYMSVAVTVSGDGRCDSPGHSVKFCCHSLMHNSKIVDVQLVQSNEVANSNHMEGEGHKRGVEQLRSSTHLQMLRNYGPWSELKTGARIKHRLKGSATANAAYAENRKSARVAGPMSSNGYRSLLAEYFVACKR